MKSLSVLCMAGALWLAGCATSAPPSTAAHEPAAASSPTDSGRTPAAVSVTETAQPRLASVFPDGPLQPISAEQAAARAVAQLTPPTDLWERIRRGFAMPDLQSDLVRDREQWYATRPDYIQRMTDRSSKYLFHIVEELELRDMPTELALLPFIESAFNPQAVSSAKAAGMWQFMPATGKHFELRQNVFRDDRRDVLASTRAALDYLQKLHGMFGDWHLALAAYNWGEGSVGRAIAKNRRAGLGTTYTDLTMPAETRYYVPKLQAVKNIIADPSAFKATLPDVGNHPYFQSVPITRDIDVALAARLAEVDVEDFRALNPSARRPVILAAGTPQILLPWDNATVFRQNLASYNSTRLASWTAWTAPSTMKPANAARRVGMTEGDLRSLNNIPPRMLIKAGSTLLVPRGERVSADVSGHVADHAQLALVPEASTRRKVVTARKGDSVGRLARRHGVSASNVAEWNQLHMNVVLKAGQKLVVYLPVRAASGSKANRSSRKAAPRSGKTRKAPRRR